jgi:hypothetical protein
LICLPRAPQVAGERQALHLRHEASSEALAHQLASSQRLAQQLREEAQDSAAQLSGARRELIDARQSL